ncbi:MAG: hypothetical protein AAF654_00065 [Myxococcota bacterium]
MTRYIGAIAAALCPFACTLEIPDVNESTSVECSTSAECPSGLVCISSGRCVSPNNDLTALTVGFADIEDELLGAGDTLAVDLEFSRALSADPTVSANGLPLATQPAATALSCRSSSRVRTASGACELSPKTRSVRRSTF